VRQTEEGEEEEEEGERDEEREDEEGKEASTSAASMQLQLAILRQLVPPLWTRRRKFQTVEGNPGGALTGWGGAGEGVPGLSEDAVGGGVKGAGVQEGGHVGGVKRRVTEVQEEEAEDDMDDVGDDEEEAEEEDDEDDEDAEDADDNEEKEEEEEGETVMGLRGVMVVGGRKRFREGRAWHILPATS